MVRRSRRSAERATGGVLKRRAERWFHQRWRNWRGRHDWQLDQSLSQGRPLCKEARDAAVPHDRHRGEPIPTGKSTSTKRLF